jgi:hypothetical protein
MMNHTNLSKHVRWPISRSLFQRALAGFLSLTAVILASTTIARADVVFSDGTFNLADWQTTEFFMDTGGILTTSQQIPGGNPGYFMRIDHYLNACQNYPWGSVVYGLYSPVDAAYTPSVDDAISSIDFSIDFKNFNTSADGVGFGLAVRQDGNIYHILRRLSQTSPVWQSEVRMDLKEEDFGLRIQETLYFTTDFDQHPDFGPSGSMLEFGFFTYASNSQEIPWTQDVGFDNWMVSIEPIPEPTTFAFLALGALVLKKRKKSN